MRRFLTLVCVLGLAVPAGISITGCTRNPAAKYCSATTGYGGLITSVTSITFQPQFGGISLAYGQTQQATLPSAYTCTGAGAQVSSSQYSYGTTNNQLVDISPTGNICAGTWNRNSGGGIPDYTICQMPNPAPDTKGLPYSVVYITASADSVTSNPVAVYVHAPVTSVKLVGPQSCLSQTDTAQLDAQACFTQSDGKQHLLCAPAGTTDPACPLPYVTLANGQQQQIPMSSIPTCESSIGTLNFSVSNSDVAKINSTNNQITAQLPGTTAITASIAGSGSSAGYFSTCPPKSISVKLANGDTSGVITQGVQQNLTTVVTDTKGNAITGLSLDYQSTNPINIQAGSSGGVTTRFPGVASITAVCQPPACNPSPINEIGSNGTGTSIASNPVSITTPGTTSNYVWFAAPGNSQYFVPYQMLTNTVGSTVRLPYVPNSMVMDQSGHNLYFGSPRELMVYSTISNTLTKQDPNVPGVVLAVAPNNTQVLINDPIRQLFYLYNAASGSSLTFGGLGVAAEWTPDSKTLYIVDSASANDPAKGITGHTNTLYVYNGYTGWTTYSLDGSGGAQSLAITVPSVGAFLSGNSTVVHTWCPTGTVGNGASLMNYPQVGSVSAETNVLAATTGGKHILGAGMDPTTGAVTLDDIGVTIPTTACQVSTTGTGSSQVQTMMPLQIPTSLAQTPVANIVATELDQIIPSPVSDLAFITYKGSSPDALLPYYIPAAGSTPSELGYVTFTGGSAVTAPLTGTFSPDDNTFFVSTAGDDEIHLINIPKNVSTSNPPTDTQQISPNLPACTPVSAGGKDAGCTYTGSSSIVPATAITVVPRSTT